MISMANRHGLHFLSRHGSILLLSPSVHRPLRTIHHFHTLSLGDSFHFKNRLSKSLGFPSNGDPVRENRYCCFRPFSSDGRDDGYDYLGNEGEYVEADDEEIECVEWEAEDEEDAKVIKSEMKMYSKEKIEQRSAEIGYKVLGRLDLHEKPFKRYEPYFAVFQLGSHQFKVSNGDYLFSERLKHCDVLDKLKLTRVLMLGSKNQTIIGRPLLPDAAVYAVVEEHMKEKKVIIFKKKKRKNYRRTKGHRQRLTRLRILDIQGIEKTEGTRARRSSRTRAAVGKLEEEPIAS